MADLITPKKENYVTKSEKLLKARYELNELAIKLIAILYSNVKRGDEIGKDYEIKVTDIAKLLNKDYGELYNEIKEAVNELMSNPVFIPDDDNPKNWTAFNWIADARYRDGVITFTISKRLKPFVLELQNRFLKYKLENILPLKSKYVIRLYEVLKDWLELNKRYGNKTEKIISLVELREFLDIPKSYRYNDIKRQILNKAQEELVKNTDLTFEFEEIKTGRKVTHIKFKIIDKSQEKKDTQLKEINYQIDIKNNLALWKKEILQNANDKIIALGDECYLIKDGLLTDLSNKIISKEDAWEVWNKFFKNKDEVRIFDKDKLNEILEKRKEKLKQFELEELKEQWLGVLVEDIHINGDFYAGQIVDIHDYKDYDNFSVIVKVGEKYYKVSNVNLNWLKNHSIIK